MSISSKLRIPNEFDIVKGIAIICVVVGHAPTPSFLKVAIYGFHMPLFFIIAGMLYDKSKWEKLGFFSLIKKRAVSYLFPYFILSGINLILNAIDEYAKLGSFDDWLSSQIYHIGWIIYSPGLAKLTPNCTPLWFLPCLFITYIYFYYIIRCKPGQQIVACLLALFLNRISYVILPRSLVRALPWHLDVALIGMVFMLIGYYLKSDGFLQKLYKNKLCFVLILTAGIVAGYLNKGKVGLASNDIGNFFYLIIYSTVVTLFLVLIGGVYVRNSLDTFSLFAGIPH